MKIFENIEEKIKLLAKILFIFSCVSAVICFLGFLDSIAWVAIIVPILIVLCGYIGSLSLFAFAKLLENTSIIAESVKEPD